MRRTRLVILAANGTRDRHSRPRYRPVRQGERAGHFPESTERGWAVPHQVDWGKEERQGKGLLVVVVVVVVVLLSEARFCFCFCVCVCVCLSRPHAASQS
jgi:hypothetical protein